MTNNQIMHVLEEKDMTSTKDKKTNPFEEKEDFTIPQVEYMINH